jgi:AAA domain
LTIYRAVGKGLEDWAPTIVNEPQGDDGQLSWAPVDVRVARESRSVVLPTILMRSDGPSLFYRGRVHSVHGETESGKSWLVQCATAECLVTGEPVLYLDFEDEAGSVAERLIRLGVAAETVDNPEVFVYVHPETPPTTDREKQAFNALLSGTYSLAVVDGVTDSMSLFGLSGMDAGDVARWHRELPNAVAHRTGAAVVCVDHVAKDSQTRGRFALGSQHKLAGLSGAAYVVEMEQPFAVGQAGRASVRVGKDRPGRVRGLGGRWRKADRTQHVADLLLDSTDSERTIWALDPPTHGGRSTDTDGKPSKSAFRPTWSMEQVSRYWEETDDPKERTNSKTVAAMCEERRLKDKPTPRQHWRDAIKLLEAEEFASSEEGARKSRIYTSLKPYRQQDDPLSDVYAEAAGRDVENWKVQLGADQDSDEK